MRRSSQYHPNWCVCEGLWSWEIGSCSSHHHAWSHGRRRSRRSRGFYSVGCSLCLCVLKRRYSGLRNWRPLIGIDRRNSRREEVEYRGSRSDRDCRRSVRWISDSRHVRTRYVLLFGGEFIIPSTPSSLSLVLHTVNVSHGPAYLLRYSIHSSRATAVLNRSPRASISTLFHQ